VEEVDAVRCVRERPDGRKKIALVLFDGSFERRETAIAFGCEQYLVGPCRWRHLFARTGLKPLIKLALEFLAQMDTKPLDSGEARNPSSGEDSSLNDLFHSVVP